MRMDQPGIAAEFEGLREELRIESDYSASLSARVDALTELLEENEEYVAKKDEQYNELVENVERVEEIFVSLRDALVGESAEIFGACATLIQLALRSHYAE